MGKTKKVRFIIICIIGITLLTSVSFANQNDKSKVTKNNKKIEVSTVIGNDSIDQQQPKGDNFGYCINFDQWGAQSFIPTMPTLTRIKLRLFRIEKEYPDYELTVSIKEKLGGNDLTNISLKPSNISGLYGGWNEFDFPDISIEPYQKYYIFCMAQGNKDNGMYCWTFEENNPYRFGDLFLTYDQGKYWYPFSTKDFCFITYGIPNIKPEKPQTPTGPDTGRIQKIYRFSTVADDPDKNRICYGWDWNGDMEIDEWTEFVESGQEIVCSHSWSENGTYEIRVIAKDQYGLISDWSNPLITNMARRNSHFPAFIQFQTLLKNRYPLLFYQIDNLLNQYLKY